MSLVDDYSAYLSQLEDHLAKPMAPLDLDLNTPNSIAIIDSEDLFQDELIAAAWNLRWDYLPLLVQQQQQQSQSKLQFQTAYVERALARLETCEFKASKRKEQMELEIDEKSCQQVDTRVTDLPIKFTGIAIYNEDNKLRETIETTKSPRFRRRQTAGLNKLCNRSSTSKDLESLLSSQGPESEYGQYNNINSQIESDPSSGLNSGLEIDRNTAINASAVRLSGEILKDPQNRLSDTNNNFNHPGPQTVTQNQIQSLSHESTKEAKRNLFGVSVNTQKSSQTGKNNNQQQQQLDKEKLLAGVIDSVDAMKNTAQGMNKVIQEDIQNLEKIDEKFGDSAANLNHAVGEASKHLWKNKLGFIWIIGMFIVSLILFFITIQLIFMTTWQKLIPSFIR